MLQDKVFLDTALKIIVENFGIFTAKQYEKFYINKSKEEVLISLKELLTEFVGPANAEKQLQRLTIIEKL